MAKLHLDSMRRRNSPMLPVECECGIITLSKISPYKDYPVVECPCGTTIDIDEELEILAFGAENVQKKATG